MRNEEREEMFPFFKNNKDYVFLDSGVSSIKPKIMIDSLVEFYSNYGISSGRGIGKLSLEIMKRYKKSILNISNFINSNTNEIIITSGTTDGINKIAKSIFKNLKKGDEIILGKFEHSSNFLIWNELAKEKGVSVVYYEMDLETFTIDLSHLKEIINSNTKVISLTHKYNIFGSTNNIKEVKKVVGEDVLVVVDGAQAIGQIKVDVKEMNCDVYVFGSHKMFGPFGVGVMYVKYEILDSIKPFQLGGGMDDGYDENSYVPKKIPDRFNAGTINISGVIGTSSAINFINSIGIENIQKHNEKLKDILEHKLEKNSNISIINKKVRGSILYFTYKNIDGNLVAKKLAKENIFVRSNASCVKLKNGIYVQEKAIRVSFHIYNNGDDINKFVDLLERI